MITTVTGYFKNFKVNVETTGEDFTNIDHINVEVDVSSLTTNSGHRDNHLRSEEFFYAEKFTTITFNATNVNIDEDIIQGNLTIRGITQPVTLQVEAGGIAADPYGHTKAGFTINEKISRKAFGLTWNAVTEAGGAVVGDEVKIQAEIQFIKQ